MPQVPLVAFIAVVLALAGCTAGGDGGSASRTPSGVTMPIPTKTAAVLAAPRIAAPSGVVMPTGNISGWTQVFAEDFATDVPVGHFPGTVYGPKWGAYRDGWKDTTGRGTYLPSKVLSTRGGLLDYSIRTENGVHMVSAPTPKLAKGAYGRYSVRFRADALPGYKTAWLLWPDSGRSPPDGEVDFPEGALDGQIGAFLHHANRSGQQEAFSSGARYTTWHTATTEWVRGKVTFILDGQVIGRSTTRVPDKPMHWVLQTETATDGTRVNDRTSGHVQIDWVVAYKPAAAATATKPSAAAGNLQVAAVGDIQPPSLSENSAGTAAEAAKADLILGLGDYQYESGRLSDYNAFFDKDWGRNVAKTYPVLAATHDQGWSGDPLRYWSGAGAHGYRAPVRLGPHRSYSFVRAGWHFLAIDDSCYAGQGGCSPDTLLSWVKADLAAHPSRCTVAYWHEAYFTSTSGHPAYEQMKPVVQALQAGGVDLVLQGRNHNYERFAPQTADRVADPKGLQAFVVGTGGIGFYTFKDKAANSVARTDSTYGVLQLTLGDGRYRWRFVRTGGTAFTDNGRRTCH